PTVSEGTLLGTGAGHLNYRYRTPHRARFHSGDATDPVEARATTSTPIHNRITHHPTPRPRTRLITNRPRPAKVTVQQTSPTVHHAALGPQRQDASPPCPSRRRGSRPIRRQTPEAIATPSRSSRKRARGSGENQASASRNTRRKTKDTRATDREDTEGTEAQDGSDADTEPVTPTETDIIQHLKVAPQHVNAAEDWANDLLEGQENVPGYGKIAGRNWAYIIRKVEVNIGRPEAQEKLVVDEHNHAGTPSCRTVVDIDLGPDRQVSRSHAVIAYDSDSEQWFIMVNGRNGLRVDNNLLKRGAKSYLRNGSVIEIASTQMAFITTAAENGDGPIWDASIIKQAQKSSEDDDDENDDMRPNGNSQHNQPGALPQMPIPGPYGGDFGGHQQQQRFHPHSQRAMQAMPGTPMRAPQPMMMESSPAANYARGVMMESTETIDYSADQAKVLKPPHSYAQLIGMAILSTPEQQMTLNNIYKWIMANYAFYRFNTGGWQNSIRHNLSLNKAFTKIARRTDEPGKGMKWMIEPTEFDTFVQQGMKGCRRPQPLPATQSTLASPSSPLHAVRAGVNGIKQDDDVTPPLQSFQPLYATATEAYTPGRGPKRQQDGRVGLGINNDGPDYDYLSRSTPRNNLTAIGNASGSPPALYVNDDGRIGPLDTPFPIRPSQRLAPPSTLKRPSDFIQFSSPAPFWKMDGLIGSTPWKPYDLSPLKTPFSILKKTEDEDKKGIEAEVACDEKEEKISAPERDVKGKGSPVIRSSSPPPPTSTRDAIEASPTLSRPATAVAKTLTQLAQSNKEQVASQLANELPQDQQQMNDEAATQHQLTPPTSVASVAPPPQPMRTLSQEQAQAMNGITQAANGYHQGNHQQLAQPGAYGLPSGHPVAPPPPPTANGYHVLDEGDDEGIDLARGFQPIGSFHQRNHMAMTMAAPAYGR
ncbi:FORKHEAD protein, partial [Teratosphaeria destructans]